MAKLRLSNTEINLPAEYCLEQRKHLMEQILAQYPDEFKYPEKMIDVKYGKRVDTNKPAMIKMDVLTTYVLRGKSIDNLEN